MMKSVETVFKQQLNVGTFPNLSSLYSQTSSHSANLVTDFNGNKVLNKERNNFMCCI